MTHFTDERNEAQRATLPPPQGSLTVILGGGERVS